MKKILVFALTATIILSAIVISTFAMDEVPYSYVLEFVETKKAYPIADSINNAVPFFEYYEVNDHNNFIHFTKEYEDASMQFSANRNFNSITVSSNIIGSYPNFDFTLVSPSDGLYTDFAIISNSQGDFDIIGFNNGTKTYIKQNINEEFTNFTSGIYNFNEILYTETSDGYYVSFPVDPVVVINDGVVGTIIESIGSFVLGLGSAFAVAFESVFMVNGQLNALSIFLLVLFGCALAYGCVRWITGLFRKET